MKVSDLKGYTVVSPTGQGNIGQAISAAPVDNRDLLSKTSDFITNNNLPGSQLGQAVGNSIHGVIQAVRQGSFGPIMQAGEENNANYGKVVGDTARSAALPVSLGLAAPTGVVGAAAQYGGLGAIQSGGESLARGNNLGQTATDSAIGGVIGGVAGGAFNLLGKGISKLASKTAPTALSFTSGVPKNAITQATENPTVAKQGLKMSVGDVRTQAVTAHQGLMQSLKDEFQQGLQKVTSETAQTDTSTLGNDLMQKATQTANKYGVKLQGSMGDFGKSAIVSPGEQGAVNNALQTVSTWDDYSPAGIQKLSERIGALSKFDSNGTTRSSAIVKSIYKSVGDSIREKYPDLGALKTNYATNRKVLDEIGNVLSAGKDKPTQIQGAVSRLDNLFKDNKDEYINAIRQLSERSGVDFLSLMAGGEFQKMLPGFVRGLGGGGAVGIGASVLNPYLLLLAPLFSPRAVGSLVRNAPKVTDTASRVTRGITSQAIQQTIPKEASQ